MYGQGTASLKFGNCWDTGVVKLFVDGNEISSVGPHSEQTVIFDFNNTTIQIEEHDSGIILFYDFEIPLCNDDISRKQSKTKLISDERRKKNSRNENIQKHLSKSRKEDQLSGLRPQHFGKGNKMPNHQIHNNYFDWEDLMLPNSQLRKMYMKRSRIKRNIKQHTSNITKANDHQITKLESNCGGKGITYENSSIVCHHLASSVEGLIVILNPNEPEYKTDASKNNYIGFKYLVHSPYDFPFVAAVGKAMGPNIRSYIGFLGLHTWITENADAYEPDQKKCASKYDIDLDVFRDYSRKNCEFECQAKSIFKRCGCLPYHYPEFHVATTGIWKGVNSTACNYTQLLCLSKVPSMF